MMTLFHHRNEEDIFVLCWPSKLPHGSPANKLRTQQAKEQQGGAEAGFLDKRRVDAQARVRSHRPQVTLRGQLKSRFLKIERVSSEGDVSVRLT